MAGTTALDGKSSINVKMLVMWNLLTDDDKGVTYGETPREFKNQLNSAKYAPKMETASQYGDGTKVEDYVAKDGGELEFVIRGYTAGDNEFLFGETATSDGTAVSGQNDIVPYVCAAYATERPDGLLNLYKFPKTKFMPQGEDARQREGGGINYGTATIKGTYSPLLNNGNDCYKRYGVNPKDDKDFIDSWFTKADFYTSTEAEAAAVSENTESSVDNSDSNSEADSAEGGA